MQYRYEVIDKFLHFWRDIIIENNNISISPDQIYSKLVRLGINYNKDYNVSLENVFERFIYYYRNHPKMTAFYSPNCTYFCHFRSRDDKNYKAKEHIKIYIPLDSEHIEAGAQMLFKFIIDNNISHGSKIGKRIRFDDVVVRVCDIEDAKKILNFVKNNKYIQDGLIQPNPFAYSQNGVALACDGSSSYNDVVSQLIYTYITVNRGKNLDKIGINHFYQYLSYIYSKEFIDNEDNVFRQALKSANLYNEYIKNRDNYRLIVELIISSMNSNFTLEDYFSHYKRSLLFKDKRFANSTILNKEEVNKILLYALSILTKSGYNANEIMQQYVNTNNLNLFANDQNLKNYLVSKNFRFNFIRELNGMSVVSYVKILLNVNSNSHDNSKSSDVNVNNYSIDIIRIMSRKYGYKEALIMLKEYIEMGEETKISRIDNLRDRVISSKYRDKVLKFIRKRNISIDRYIYNIKRSLNGEILFESLKKTYIKYEEKNKNGHAQIFCGLDGILKNGDYSAITGENNAREDIKCLSREEIINVLVNVVNFPYKENYSSREIEHLVIEYINMVQQQVNNVEKHHTVS